MTKRDEIDRAIEFVLMAAYHAGKTGESISETIDKSKIYLKKELDSMGVVIKSDRELPELKALPEQIFENQEETFHAKACYLAGIKDCQEKLREDTGYVATVRLTKE